MIAPPRLHGGDPKGAGRAEARPVAVVSDVQSVARRLDDLGRVLLDPGAEWLLLLADRPAMRLRGSPHASAHGNVAGSPDAHLVNVRVGVGPLRLPVALSVGLPRIRARGIVVPVRWDPTVLDRFVPTLDGDIDLSAEGRESRLGLSARYRAPLGEAGRALDRTALHRLAESSVRDFLEEVKATLLALTSPA